jgi:FMN-dependent oxidoreductase (nitrilotriacetate monooxygenase family)
MPTTALMTTDPRTLHLNLNFLNAGTAGGAWRYSEQAPDSFIDVKYYGEIARLAEKGKFDAVFLADFLGIANAPEFAPFQSLDPAVALTAMAAQTSHIGLVGTQSSTYTHPYHVARSFASLDHVSGGRAGVNIVTSADKAAARNFGLDNPVAHAERYQRAAEYIDVLNALWDSWDKHALVGDKASGRFVDPAAVRPIAHQGRHFSVHGPLNVPRAPQGRPVLFQAGGSDDGLDLAARYADAVFSQSHTLADAQEYAASLRTRVVRAGRDPFSVLIFPGLVTILGDTEASAKSRQQELRDLVPLQHGLGRLAGLLQIDPAKLALDAPLPPSLVVPPDGMTSFARSAIKLASERRWTVRQLVEHQMGGTNHRVVVGTPQSVAADMARWFKTGAVNGFNIMPDVFPDGLAVFVEQVVPELQRLGVFREAYESGTLRGHLGLDVPQTASARVPVAA